MIKTTLIDSLKKDHKARDRERSKIIGRSNPILHDSKRIIFSLHRSDFAKADEQMIKVEKEIDNLQDQFGYKRLEEEGAYKAAMEEYLEAKLFHLWINKKEVTKIKGRKISHSSYLGALSDVAGEMVRYAINQAAKNNLTEVGRAKEDVSELISYLTEFDFTGYLRTKYDQARSHMRKIEQINYEVNLRK